MKKIGWVEVILFAIIVSVMAIITVPAAMQESTKLLPLSNVVQIKVISIEIDWYTGEPIKRQATGVFIRDDLILTAGHLVDDISDANVFTVDGKEYKAKGWYLETEADIGFIEVDTNDVECTLFFDDAKFGETVWAFGNPLGVFPVLVKGIISATNATDSYNDTKNMIIIDAAVNGGNSGCPIFDKWGNILGICSWHYPGQEGMNYFVRAEVIEAILEKYDAIKYLEGLE